MTIYYMHPTEMGVGLHPNCNTLLAAIPRRHPGHLIGALQRDREAANNGVPILLVPAAHRRMKVIFPAKLRGDQRGLVGMFGTRSADIQFLQTHKFIRHARYYLRDATFLSLPILADPTVHFVSSNA